MQAITSRYGKRDDELTAKINQQKLLKLQQEMNAPFVELVGFDDVTEKQRYFFVNFLLIKYVKQVFAVILKILK